MTIVDTLCELNAAPILIQAAYHGLIDSLECRFVDTDECLCPDGRWFFTKRGDPRHSPWAPSADRWPVPGRDGGEYVIENVRLAHYRCNVSAGGRASKGGSVTQARWRGTHKQHGWAVEGGRRAIQKMSKEAKSRGGRASATARTFEQRSAAGRANVVANGGWAFQTPEQHSAASRAAGLITCAQRVTCECGKISTPGGMGQHCKATGHRKVVSG
jgi:hypothetical protein